MSTPLPTIDLSAATVGTTGTIDLSRCAPTANPRFTNTPAMLQLYNESGVGLRLNGVNSDLATDLPAGAWKDLPVATAETAITYTVVYVLQNAPVNTLLATYYAPGEAAGVGTTLGNSPVNVGNGNVASQVLQFGAGAPNPVVQASPQGTFGGAITEALINNDGSAKFGNVAIIGPHTVSWDTAGDLTAFSLIATQPLNLLTGNQETGWTGGGNSNAVNTAAQLYGTNFKTTMQNTPSSITLSVAASNNTNAPFASQIHTVGFSLSQTATANGSTFWHGTYTTVGN